MHPHADIGLGYAATREDPGQDAECTCKLAEDRSDNPYWENLFDEGDPATKCLHFSPNKIDKCANCSTKINQPEYRWTLGVYCQFKDATIYACCDNCRAALRMEYDRLDAIEAIERGQLISFDRTH